MLIYEVSEEVSSDFLAFFALGFLGLGSLAVRQVVLVVVLDLLVLLDFLSGLALFTAVYALLPLSKSKEKTINKCCPWNEI